MEHDGNRNNNFTLIRITFAWFVLYGHGFLIQETPGIVDPTRFLFQGSTWIGDIAVDGFFAISGYLVTASLVNRGLINYIISRILRILPALMVMVCFTVFIIGPLFTETQLSTYFSSRKTFAYLTNALAYFDMKFTLPGLFESNHRVQVNGSIWTLTLEVKCYVLLAITGLLSFLKNKAIANIFISLFFIVGFFNFW